ncbi:O-antigen polysaccharide polymerase Wzy [Clostridium perfringens]|uniref:O-antigen polysaccharide polymerase Wzy family protein n=1 Tax=Clostridium perfringens TaxID=1502 RepID=UPI002AC52B52|nr:O-antigen polysaccharide polymerase Wzy family protein [Clostridium perfringens]MDK0841042.1 O-antigen polysaccharide polymerase Wzy family protein [Clostridium perfringens]MDZ4937183.1 O-antigen polysaccharide polymerase Wzy [Clostridium perfringens]
MNSKNSLISLIIYLFLLSSTIINYMLGITFERSNNIIIAIVFAYLICIFYSLKKISERMGLLILSTSIFLFQVSRSFVRMISGEQLEQYFTYEQVFNTLNIIFISFIGLILGYIIIGSHNKKREVLCNSINNEKYLNVAKFIYYISLPFAFFEIIMKIKFVLTNGYLNYYTSFSLPLIVSKFSDFYLASFIILLALLPKLNRITKEIKIFILYCILSLFSGQRNTFIIPILFIVWYFSYRDMLNLDKSKIITKKFLVICGLSIIIIIPTFIFIGDLRMGESGQAIFKRFFNFFDELGSSNHVLLRTLAIEDVINQNDRIKFLFYPIKNLINSNIISQLIFNTKIYQQQTVEYALNTFNYGAYHTYICDPVYYLSGGGFGSSYLAEAYLALGKLGVFIISILYSFYIKLASKIKYKNWMLRSIVFFSIYGLFFSPRDLALQFLVFGFNITNILTILIVFFVGNISIDKFKRIY